MPRSASVGGRACRGAFSASGWRTVAGRRRKGGLEPTGAGRVGSFEAAVPGGRVQTWRSPWQAHSDRGDFRRRPRGRLRRSPRCRALPADEDLGTLLPLHAKSHGPGPPQLREPCAAVAVPGAAPGSPVAELAPVSTLQLPNRPHTLRDGQSAVATRSAREKPDPGGGSSSKECARPRPTHSLPSDSYAAAPRFGVLRPGSGVRGPGSAPSVTQTASCVTRPASSVLRHPARRLRPSTRAALRHTCQDPGQ